MSSVDIGLLDLRKDASICLDGVTIILRTDDFVGISGVMKGFHLVSVRPSPQYSISMGFIMSGETSLVRKYDATTEEVSSDSVDQLTAQNLLRQIRSGCLPANNVVDYSKVISLEKRKDWLRQTSFIDKSGILRKRKLGNGDKIVPGSYEDGNDPSTNLRSSAHIEDGKSIAYPHIPVVSASKSVRNSMHLGTKNYLRCLSPSRRTDLFQRDDISDWLLEDILQNYYDNRWELILGDLQLAYVLFLYLQCLASLDHWKDLLAMLAMVTSSGISSHPELYAGIVDIISFQITSMDQGFLEDVDEAGDNFILPALKNLCKNIHRAGILSDDNMLQFERVLSNKFPSMLVLNDQVDPTTDLMKVDGNNSDDDEDDSDAPVVIDESEVLESLVRSSKTHALHREELSRLPSSVIHEYPLLVAAIVPGEDILMTCARALDEKNDVSLVREAAAYLEALN